MKSYTLYEFQRNLTTDEKALLYDEKPLEGEHIVITGKLGDAFSRSDASVLLTRWGAFVGSSVSAATTLLICTNPDRRTAKRVDAERHGTTVLGEVATVRWLERKLADLVAASLAVTPPPPDEWFAGTEPEAPEIEDLIAPLTDFAG